jgi:pyruvate/2-oxoglutarate dehydrogenase complex dihydrolipoamide acyltransferase (E2) component
MSSRKLTLPDLGIDDQSITLSSWYLNRGERVSEGEPLVEVLCGGVTVDLPSPAEGILVEKCAAEDDIIAVGQTLAIIKES